MRLCSLRLAECHFIRLLCLEVSLAEEEEEEEKREDGDDELPLSFHSAKRGRRAKVLSVTQQVSQKGSSNDQTDSPNLSSIERGSFLEGLQQAYGNPLHSTAMEEDLSVPEEGRTTRGKAGRKEIPQLGKSAVKQSGAGAKRKEVERDGENEEEQEKKKRSRRSTGGARPAENQQVKRASEAEQGKTSGAAPQDQSDTGRKRVLSSSEGEDGDGSWSPRKANVLNLARSRKSSSNKSKPRASSSGSASAGSHKPNRDEQRRKRRAGGDTETEVVLDAFLDFCDQYRESVESKAVKQAVDSFSSNVEEQLLEKISSSRESKVIKKENAKVASWIHAKKRRLLEAKHALMRAEREAWKLQKEKSELKGRLADLRLGQAFLQDFRELNRLYLDHRRKQPKEKETYGASSLPALLLETKRVRTTEHH